MESVCRNQGKFCGCVSVSGDGQLLQPCAAGAGWQLDADKLRGEVYALYIRRMYPPYMSASYACHMYTSCIRLIRIPCVCRVYALHAGAGLDAVPSQNQTRNRNLFKLQTPIPQPYSLSPSPPPSPLLPLSLSFSLSQVRAVMSAAIIARDQAKLKVKDCLVGGFDRAWHQVRPNNENRMIVE